MVAGEDWPLTSALEMEDRGRAAGVVVPGVQRPGVVDGVTRPAEKEGVTRPFDATAPERDLRPEGIANADGVILPESGKGVTRPFREEATDEGRETLGPVVAVDNFVAATNTPQFGGQVKYCMLELGQSAK